MLVSITHTHTLTQASQGKLLVEIEETEELQGEVRRARARERESARERLSEPARAREGVRTAPRGGHPSRLQNTSRQEW